MSDLAYLLWKATKECKAKFIKWSEDPRVKPIMGLLNGTRDAGLVEDGPSVPKSQDRAVRAILTRR